MEIPSKTAFFFGRCPLAGFSLFCKFSLFILQKKNSSLQDGRIGRGASAAADAPPCLQQYPPRHIENPPDLWYSDLVKTAGRFAECPRIGGPWRRTGYGILKKKAGFDRPSVWKAHRDRPGGKYRNPDGMAVPLRLRTGNRRAVKPAAKRTHHQLRLRGAGIRRRYPAPVSGA